MGGVDFALQCFDGEVRPRYLSFLEVLTEFSTKLIKQDKGTVLSYLEQQLPDGQQPQTQDEYWIPYMAYRNTLQQSNGKNMPPRGTFSTTAGSTSTRSRNSSMSSSTSAGAATTMNASEFDQQNAPAESTRIAPPATPGTPQQQQQQSPTNSPRFTPDNTAHKSSEQSSYYQQHQTFQ